MSRFTRAVAWVAAGVGAARAVSRGHTYRAARGRRPSRAAASVQLEAGSEKARVSSPNRSANVRGARRST